MIPYVMLYTVAVGVPIFGAAWGVSGVLRRYGRPERMVWLAALLLSFALPTLALLSRMLPTAGAAPAATAPAMSTGVIGLPEVVAVPDATGAGTLVTLLIALWAAVSLWLAARLAVAAVRLARASRSWRPSTMDGLSVWLTDTMGPAVAGLLHPRVLVPSWLARMPADRRSLVLLHEQEHIRAGDPWLMLASRVAPILTPWNPVVWLISARLLRAVELDCDRRVLRQRPDVRAYGSTLIEISHRDTGRLVAVAAFAESEAPLRSRILNITTPSRTVSVVALLTSMVFGVILMIAAFEIPVPTLRAELQLGPPSSDAAVVDVDADDRAVRGERAGGVATRGAIEEARADASGAWDAATEVGGETTGVRREATGVGEETSGMREEAEAREAEARRTASEEGSARPTAASPGGNLSARPTFTPFTLAPRLLNLREVQRALADEYPTVLQDSGIEGTVRLWFFIDADGRVAQTRVDQSSGYLALDDAALRVASVYRFSPALNRDERVPVWVSLPITFQVR